MLSVFVAIALYLTGSIKTYNRLHTFLLYPSNFNQFYYESGYRRIEFDYKFFDSESNAVRTSSWWFESPSPKDKPLAPFCDWMSSRAGTGKYMIDVTGSRLQCNPPISFSIQQRVKLTAENIIFYLFGRSWPMDTLEGGERNWIIEAERFIWCPLFIAIAVLTVMRRRLEILPILSLCALLFFLFQQSFILEGRYRIPLEGIAVATFLSLLSTQERIIHKLSWQKLRKPAISAFVAVYAFAAFLWLLPGSPRRDDFLRPLEPAILYLGLWQVYTMFAPNPRLFNPNIDVEMKCSDGTRLLWHYPRMEQFNLLERMQKERFRKYGYEHLNDDSEKMLRTDFARWLARQCLATGKIPTTLTFIRRWADIPPPDKGLGKPLPPHSNEFIFFRYEVRPEDLK